MADSHAASPAGTNLIERGMFVAGLALLVAVVGLELGHAGEVLIFSISAVTLALLAWLLGEATDQLGHRVGGRIAGLLNATLGNLPELVVVILLVRAATPDNGFIEVAKASIIGSVLGNLLFVLGLAFLVGGLRHGTQRYNAHFATQHASMLLLAVAAISVPTLIQYRGGVGAEHIEGLSIAAAIVLFLVYVAAVRFFLSEQADAPEEKGEARWSARTALLVLAGSAIGVGVASEALVGSMEHTIQSVGISEAFMGFILVPVVGNIAEHLVAVLLAYRNDMDFANTIALGSSVQVALGLAPAALFISLLFTHHLDLVFNPQQLLALALGAIIIPVLVHDGESTWIEGLQLLSLYVLIAIGFWY